jgi:hypothetical protein
MGTLNKTGSLEELIDIMKERKINIFCLSGTKWLGQGRKKLREVYEIIWSDEATEKRNGIESPAYTDMVTESECISGRKKERRILVKEKEMNILQINTLSTSCSNE